MAQTQKMELVEKLLHIARITRRKRHCGNPEGEGDPRSGGQGHRPHSCGRALRILCESQGGMSQARLADALDVRPQSLTEIISGLEESGLVERVQNPENRRELVVTVTDEGRRLGMEAERRLARDAENLLYGLAPEELTALNTLLDKILSNVRDRGEARP